MCFALVACGGKNDTTPADTTPADTPPADATPADTTPAGPTPADTTPADTTPAEPEDDKLDAATVNIFIAASLEGAFKEIIEMYKQVQPNVTINYNADSSGALLTQISEANGNGCDIFFSAAVKQVKSLNDDYGLMVEGSRVDLLCNQVCVISAKGSGTAVTGLANIADAKSIALADGSVPVGKYTRQALVNLGVIGEAEDVATITTEEIAEQLGGVEINECGNVSKVKEAVKEGSNEVGTVYYSDAYSVRDDVDIIEMVSTELTGDIIYPMCRVTNGEADEAETAAAIDFYEYIQSDDCLKVFEDYMFVIYEG
jgi:molybdate transport system substrate-binding protein